MGFEEMLLLAAKIGTGKYGHGELDRFLQFMETAEADQKGRLLDAYQESLEQQKIFPLQVNMDFMERLKALRPVAEADKTQPAFSQMPPSFSRMAVSEPNLPNADKKMIWLRRVSAAAAAVLIMASGIYFYSHNKNEKPVTIAQLPTDVKAPQRNRATITLASGQKVFLDSASNGQLALQNNVKLLKSAHGKIAYDAKQVTSENAGALYNTLENPRGSRVIDLVLSDGTHVWLNAGSSLTYPVAFSGRERNVEITGEAYFEVTHNAAMPFTVKKLHGDTRIQVLGTHFNVNAYDDEESLKVTLLAGAVNVTTPANARRLSPGEQASVQSGKIELRKNIDTDEVMAWKNGKFEFGDASDVATIMRQISRWYDVEVEYQGTVTGHVGGAISREVNASQVLKMLQTTGVIKYKIQGNKVMIMPAAP